ncbi:MAG: DUF3822 family protein [Lutibacter sp.]|nr:DUF3822 family protein [Lutibacter sp.]
MIKEINKITNNNVDYLNLQENHLSIQLSLDGFSFCIYNSIQNEIGAFAVYEFESPATTPFNHLELVEQVFEKELLLQVQYENVIVIHCNNLVTQVPKPFFNKNNLANYLQNTIKILENDFITYDEMSNSEIVNIYIPFVNINNFLLDKYGTFEYKHSSTILIELILNSFKNAEGDFCFINVSNNSFEIVVLKNKTFELFNSFTFNTKEDFIYYILFTVEQLKLNPEEFKLIFSGEIEKESELYSIAYQYIRNVSFYNLNNFPAILSDVSSHSHLTLLNQL